MNLNLRMKRFSFFDSSSDANVELDEQLRSLYMDPLMLEQKCLDSSLRTDYNKVLSKILATKTTMSSGGVEEEIAYSKSPEAVVEGLPPLYFTPAFDPIEPHLVEIGQWDEAELLEKFMNKIEEADTDKDVIISHLTSMIESNYDDLLDCMANVQSIHMDLCKASILVSHGRRKIRSASEIIYSGAIKIKGINMRRAKLKKLSETVTRLKALKDIHHAMLGCINTGEVGRAADHARRVLESLKLEAFDQFSAFVDLSSSMDKSVIKIRQKADTALRRLCGRKFSAADYENIVTAYVLLDYMSEAMGVETHSGGGGGGGEEAMMMMMFDPSGCIEGLSQRVTRSQLEDIDAALHSAVMEYIYASQQKKKRAADELSIAGAYLQMNFGELVDLAEVPLNVLYRRLTADTIAPCIVRSCELLADVVHTHFVITQWHRAPFDPRNLDGDSSGGGGMAFLHRHIEVVTTQQQPGAGAEGVQNVNNFAIIDLADDDDDDEHDDDGDDDDDDDEDGGIYSVDSSTKALLLKKQLDKRMKLTQMKAAATAVGLQSSSSSSPSSSFLHESILSSIQSSFQEHFTPFKEQQQQQHCSSPNLIYSSIQSRIGMQLARTYESLLLSRTMLWDEVLRALVDMLSMMVFTAEVKIEDFLSMAWALNSMVDLGREYCQSTSEALTHCLRVKSQEYFYNFHCESFQTLRDMVEAESWHCFPIDLEERHGIIGIIKGVLLRDSSRLGMIYFKSSPSPSGISSSRASSPSKITGEGSAADAAAVSVSMLSRFATEGNPFHVVVATNHRDGEVMRSSSPIDEVGQGQGEGAVIGRPISSDPSTAPTVAGGDGDGGGSGDGNNCFWSLLTRDDSTSTVSKRQHQQKASMIVTQVALNGIAKYVAKYLLLMYLLPSTAPLIFEQLTDLFNYYVCAVFNGFMPIEEKQRFLAAPTKINAPPPDQSREYEVLRAYLEAVLDSPVVTSAVDSSSSHYHSTIIAATDTSHDSYNDVIGTSNTDLSEVENGDLPMPNSQQQQQSSSSSSHHHRKSINVTSPTSTTTITTPPRTGTKMVLLLRPPAVPLHLESSCMALNERIVAAESCYFIAKVSRDDASVDDASDE